MAWGRAIEAVGRGRSDFPSQGAAPLARTIGRASQTTMRGGSLMRNERNGHQTALLLFAVAVIVAMLMAFFTTFERVEKRTATSQTAPGTTGLATARPPLDRASGQPVLDKGGQSAGPLNGRASPSFRRAPADNRRKSALLAWYVAADRRRSEP